MKYLVNCKVVFPDSVKENQTVAYDDSIREIGENVVIPENAEVTDAKGNLLIPGLIDMHIHGYLGCDSSDGDADGLKKMAVGIAANGVTSFLPTTMTVGTDDLNRAFDAARSVIGESRTWDGAEILGINAEGPFISESKKGAQLGDYIRKPDAEFVLDNADIIRSVTIASETDENHSCIREIARHGGINISLGHTAANYNEAMNAIRDGATSATHLFNAMTGLQHREPGVVGAVFNSDVWCELIADTFHVNPALFAIVARQKPGKVILITDAMRAAGLENGEFMLGGQKVTVNGIQCRLSDGTIAGSVLKLNLALRNFLEYSGLPLHEVVNCATLHPAEAIHAEKKGAIRIGNDADMVICTESFEIIKTIKRGKTIYTK